MTLIEVLAALLLMGSILVALVTARGRLVNQHAEAQAIQDAARAADALLVRWWASDPPAVPVSARGQVAGQAGWVWTTTPVAGAPDALELQAVRLSILDERDPSNPRKLVEVEVLVPLGGWEAGHSTTEAADSVAASRLVVRP